MKKIVSVVLGIVLTLGAIALTSSCKKDIDNAKGLVGSTWVAQDGGDTYKLTFPSASEFKMTCVGDNRIVKGVFIITGNKTSLAGSYITLTPDSAWWDDDLLPLSGEFESNSRLNIEDGEMIFTRSVQ